MSYDIAADWTINTRCNFNCDYCFFGDGVQIEHPSVGAHSIDSIAEFFNGTSKIWHLHITGGEPFLYPQFADLCKLLTQQHFISINSNLSSPRVNDFAEQINPERVKYIHLALIQKNVVSVEAMLLC